MLTAVMQSLIAPRNSRRYVGRHRERVDSSGFSVGVDAALVIAPKPGQADGESSAELARLT